MLNVRTDQLTLVAWLCKLTYITVANYSALNRSRPHPPVSASRPRGAPAPARGGALGAARRGACRTRGVSGTGPGAPPRWRRRGGGLQTARPGDAGTGPRPGDAGTQERGSPRDAGGVPAAGGAVRVLETSCFCWSRYFYEKDHSVLDGEGGVRFAGPGAGIGIVVVPRKGSQRAGATPTPARRDGPFN